MGLWGMQDGVVGHAGWCCGPCRMGLWGMQDGVVGHARWGCGPCKMGLWAMQDGVVRHAGWGCGPCRMGLWGMQDGVVGHAGWCCGPCRMACRMGLWAMQDGVAGLAPGWVDTLGRSGCHLQALVGLQTWWADCIGTLPEWTVSSSTTTSSGGTVAHINCLNKQWPDYIEPHQKLVFLYGKDVYC